ncbi:MAG TPA: SRPBCC domain-containing protein [Thermomicrobiales bacterium]|nr:SRPBCC domain-containing protein [Thermomicrobiales bacterium]
MSLPSVSKDAQLNAPPDQVFDALTRPEQLTQWFAQRVEVDVRPEGGWTFDWPPHMQARGRYLAVERPHRLVWTWDASIPDSRPDTFQEDAHPPVTMEYTFAPEDGGTRLTIVESGHVDDEAAARNGEGLEMTIQGLRAYLEDGVTIDWDTLPKPE